MHRPPSKMFDLLPHQTTHVKTLTAILDTHRLAFDFSMMGTGKTYTSSYIALTSKIPHVLVVCPLTVAPKWTQMGREHGVPIAKVLSYHSLRGMKNRQPKHGLLVRDDVTRTIVRTDDTPETVDTVVFRPTDALKTLATEGMLLVIDEIQHFKNLSAQFEACRALIACAQQHERCRILLLSGSPIDKQEQTLRLFRAIGVFQADEIARYNLQTYTVEWTGLEEISAFARKVNPSEHTRMKQPWPWESGRILTTYAYQLFLKCVRPAMSSSMTPGQLPVQLVKQNGFYRLETPVETAELKAAVDTLKSVVGYNPETNTVQLTHVGRTSPTFASATLALLSVEWAKRKLFVRLAREWLERGPTHKVVLCFNYRTTLEYVAKALVAYVPLVLDGRLRQDQRARAIDAFQAPTTARRVLLGNTHVCSTGIDLDDKHGDFPRTAFISPNYSTITLYQLGHRFHRANTKSNANVFFVYGKDHPEMMVLDALSRKSEVMKEITPEQAVAGVVFPVDMASYTESD